MNKLQKANILQIKKWVLWFDYSKFQVHYVSFFLRVQYLSYVSKLVTIGVDNKVH